MIAVDSSAVIAILYREPEAARLRAALANADGAVISTGTLLELQLVVAGTRARSGWTQAEALLALYGVTARAFDERQLRLAREAATRYGKGRRATARGGTRPRSISATALPMRWRRAKMHRCSAPARISSRRISRWREFQTFHHTPHCLQR